MIVRKRRVIAGVTALALLLAVAGWFVLPPARYRNQVARGGREVRITLRLAPPVDLLARPPLIEPLLRDAPLLLAVLQQAGVEELAGSPVGPQADRGRALASVQRWLIDNRSPDGSVRADAPVALSVTEARPWVHLGVRGLPESEAVAFLNALVVALRQALTDHLQPIVDWEIAAFEAILAGADAGAATAAALQAAAVRYQAAVVLRAAPGEPFTVRSEPLREYRSLADFRRRHVTEAAVFVMAAFFFALFLAFVLNWVDRVKADPVAVRKLRDALGRGEPERESGPR